MLASRMLRRPGRRRRPICQVGLLGASLAALFSVTIITSAAAAVSSQSELASVSCAAIDHCVAVGFFLASGGEHTFAQSFNGTRWAVEATPSPGTAADLTGISCPTVKWCLAVGGNSSGTVAEELLGGRWEISKSLNPEAESSFTDVSCVSVHWCVAVGTTGRTAEPLAELYNGKKWSVMSAFVPTDLGYSLVYSVSCTAADFCVMTGSYQAGKAHPQALSEVYDGTSWAAATVPLTGPQPWLNAVSCKATTTTTKCVATGSTNLAGASSALVTERYEGGKWARLSVPASLAHDQLAAVSCRSTTLCIAVGWSGTSTTAARLSSAKWAEMRTAEPVGAHPALAGVSCPATAWCMAVGHYEGGGASQESTLSERFAGGRWAVVFTPDKSL